MGSGNLCQKIEFIAKVSAEFERELAIMKSAILTFIDGSNLTFHKAILTQKKRTLSLLNNAMKNATENLNNTTERLENEKKRLTNVVEESSPQALEQTINNYDHTDIDDIVEIL